MSMNPSEARVVDPVLTDIARGYTNQQRVGRVLFPRVEVAQRGGQILQFGKEAFRKLNMRRAPGAETQRISFGYEGDPYVLVQDSVDVPLLREIMQDAQKVPGVDMGKRATNLAMDQMTLGLEIEQAQLASRLNRHSSHPKHC